MNNSADDILRRMLCTNATLLHQRTLLHMVNVMGDNEVADMATQLEAVYAEFASQHPELASPHGARDQCSAASAAFLNLLVSRSVITVAGRTTGEWANEEAVVVDGTVHRVARVGPFWIDWTARQFDPRAAFPLVTTNPADFDLLVSWRM